MKRWQKVVGVIVAVLVVAVVAGLFVLDSVITSKAREQAQILSQQWGRPVEIGAVSTKLLTGLGVRVSDVRIGKGPGEDLPLLTIPRIEVRMALLKAATSGGKDVEIHSAEIAGLVMNLIRLPDGTTNLEQLQKKIAESAAPKKDAPAEQKPADLSFLRIDHAALTDARIVFEDESEPKGAGKAAPKGGAARELTVQHLDVVVNDLRAGKPLEILLKAAVLSEKQNLELRVKAAPLPVTLTPTPISVVLKVDPPIDLGPLGPFVGPEVGLTKGTFDADFDAQLGSAVPGGTGPTAVKGVIKLAGLTFKGAEGGKALDVLLDVDVKGDAAAGDVQIDKLRLDLGPAGITGHGKASALNTPSPRIEGLSVVGHDLDPARLAAYYPPLRKMLNGMVAGPIGLALQASGSQAAQALELKLDFTKVMLAVPEQLTKAAGAPMTIVAHVKGAAATGGPLRFDAKMDLAGVDLRPGASVDKAPGQRLEIALDGSRTANKSSTAPEQHVAVDDLKVHILDDELEGKGAVDLKGVGAQKTTHFEFALASSHLDLDKLLIPAKPKEKKPPLDPKLFAGLSGHAGVKIDKLRMSKQELTNIVADVTMVEDKITVTKAELKAFGGDVSASGTELRLAHPEEPFHVVTHLSNVGLENLVALGTDRKLLTGKFSGDIDLKGGGQGVKELAKTLAGAMDGHLLDSSFLGKDLVAAVSGPLAKALPFGLAGKTGEGGATSLGKDLPFGLTLADGVAKLKNPISITRPEATLSFSGGIRVDGNLDLPGTISLSPQTISALTGGKVKLSSPIPLSVKLTGPAWSPTVSDLDLGPAVATIVKQAGSAFLGKALGVEGGNLDEIARNKQAELQKQGEARAQAEAKKAQDAAAAAADAQRKKVEDEAKNRLKGLFGR